MGEVPKAYFALQFDLYTNKNSTLTLSSSTSPSLFHSLSLTHTHAVASFIKLHGIMKAIVCLCCFPLEFSIVFTRSFFPLHLTALLQIPKLNATTTFEACIKRIILQCHINLKQTTNTADIFLQKIATTLPWRRIHMQAFSWFLVFLLFLWFHNKNLLFFFVFAVYAATFSIRSRLYVFSFVFFITAPLLKQNSKANENHV